MNGSSQIEGAPVASAGTGRFKFPFAFTPIGFLILVVSVALYFAALTSQSGLLLLTIGILGGCYLVNLIAARRAVRHFEIFPPASTHLAEGERLSQPWKIANASPCGAVGFIKVKSPAGILFQIASLSAGDSISLVPNLEFQRRGVFRHGEITITSLYPFGLVKASRRLAVPGEVIVHPALYETASPLAAGYDLMVGGKHKGNRRSTSGSSFAGIRPLQPGDPLKQIHWRSSSKGQGLMVKTFDEELSGRVAVIVDCGASGNPKTLDACLRAAGSLIFAALDSGHHVEWLDLGRLAAQVIPPFADGHEILDTLARIELDKDSLTPGRLDRVLELVSHKSAICLVLTQINAETANQIEKLLAQRRRVSLYLPAHSTGAVAVAGLPVFHYSAQDIVEAS